MRSPRRVVLIVEGEDTLKHRSGLKSVHGSDVGFAGAASPLRLSPWTFLALENVCLTCHRLTA